MLFPAPLPQEEPRRKKHLCWGWLQAEGNLQQRWTRQVSHPYTGTWSLASVTDSWPRQQETVLRSCRLQTSDLRSCRLQTWLDGGLVVSLVCLPVWHHFRCRATDYRLLEVWAAEAPVPVPELFSLQVGYGCWVGPNSETCGLCVPCAATGSISAVQNPEGMGWGNPSQLPTSLPVWILTFWASFPSINDSISDLNQGVCWVLG